MSGINTINKVVVSVGGNALTLGKGHETMEDQRTAARVACRIIAKIWATNYQHMAVTHGNGPQVGFILERFEQRVKRWNFACRAA